MPVKQARPRIPLPRGWRGRVKSAVLHTISLAHFSIARARGMEPGWAFELRDLCVEYGIPFFWKQWGKPNNNPIYRRALETAGSKKKALEHLKQEDPDGKGGSLIEGRAWKEFPVCYTGPSPAALPVLR